MCSGVCGSAVQHLHVATYAGICITTTTTTTTSTSTTTTTTTTTDSDSDSVFIQASHGLLQNTSKRSGEATTKRT